MNNTTNMTIRIDKNLKKNVDTLFKKLGTNTNSAINMFLRQCDREQQLPFKVTMQSPEPSDRLKEALKELEDVESGKIKLKGYHNMNDFINALNEE